VPFWYYHLEKILNQKKVVWAIDCGNSNPQGSKSAYGFTYQAD